MPRPLQIVWAAIVLFGFGSGFGTYLHRATRLPSWFWLPCVSATSCLVAYGLFFVSFFDPAVGRVAAWSVWQASLVLFVYTYCRRPDLRRMLRQRDAWLPALLTVLLGLGYLASVIASDADINHRFRFPTPPDNSLPLMMAERIAGGAYGVGVPPGALDHDWRGSDRPPVQAAIALATLPLHLGDFGFFYQFVATWCQMGWVAAIYALGRTIALPRRYLQFAMIAAATSPFFFFNSVYTWPKLLSAWLCVTGLAIILHVLREADGPSRAQPIVGAGAITLGLLAHGGSAFSMLALPLLGVWWKPWRVIGRTTALAAAVTCIVILSPWVAYQRFYDPPGNRLFKLHFAGVEQIDARGTFEAMRDTYRELTWSSYLAGRWRNVTQQWFGTYPLQLEHPIDWVQWQQLMRHIPLIGFLCAGFLMLVWTPARSDLPDASLRLIRQLTWYALLTAVIWIVVMIVPSSTLVHQGSYVMTLLLLFGAAVLTAMLPPWPRRLLLMLHVGLFAACYLFSTRTASLTPAAWRLWTFVEAGAALAAFAIMLRLVPEPAKSDRVESLPTV
jgi:hypothetical protein